MSDEPKKRGRPRKHPMERKRHNHTVRLREGTRATLQARAKQNERSVSEEIEAIIERDLLLEDVRETIREEMRATKPAQIPAQSFSDSYWPEGSLRSIYPHMLADTP